MRKKSSTYKSVASRSFDEAFVQLEPRQLLDASPVTPSSKYFGAPVNWQGVQYDNWARGSWIITFQGEQSRGQAELRARQVASALGVNPTKVNASPLGRFANIEFNGMITEGAVANARNQFPFLRNVEPDLLAFPTRTPNDARFADQYPMRNTGQASGYLQGGTVGADLDAVSAWDITTGSDRIVVAILDTGIDLQHPDLIPNLWVNPGEIPGNNQDDDQNGFVDDVNGWDFVGDGQGNGDNNPQDRQDSHGTQVAGTIGARGNNAIGVVGVNWNVKMMMLKIFPDDGGGAPQSAQINALEYSVLMKRRGTNIVVSNHSYGSLQDAQSAIFNDAIQIAIQEHTDAGILYIAAAGNDSTDNDSPVKAYPASYPNPFIISVAATDNNDNLAGFSNFGRTEVDVGAPGEQILTTVPGGGYDYINGTSFASPYTAGVVALMASVNQFATKEQLKAQLLASVDVVPQLQNLVATNGRINAFKAVRGSRNEGVFVTTISPGTQASNVETIIVEFSKDIDPTFFNVSKIQLLRANGAPTFNGSEITVPITAGQVTLTGKRLTINLGAPLPRDLYRLKLFNDGFRDSLGNLLNGDMTQGNDEIYDFNVISFRGPFEPNDTLNTASPILLSNTGTALVEDLFIGDGTNPVADVDIFRIFASGPSLISASVLARSLPVFSGLDGYLRVFDSGGQQIASNDNFNGLDPKVEVFVPGAGEYYIAVSAFPNTAYLPNTEAGRTSGGSSGTFSLQVAVSTTGPQVITRTSTNVPLNIPTQGEIVSTINVTDGRSITDLRLTLDITHSFVSDLRITLTGPGGDVIELFNRRGLAGQNLTNTVFSDDATTAIAAGTAPFTGTFRPESPLTPFKNRTALGVWTLRIQDLKPLDSGTLNSWQIEFTHVNDISGPFELNDTTILATDAQIDGTGARTFEAFIGDGAFGLRDVDLYRFVAGSGTTITINIDVAQGSLLKTVLRLFDAQGTEVRADRRKAVDSGLVNFVVANAGTYYIGVSGGSNSANPSDLGNDNYLPGTGGSGNATDSTGNYTLTISVSGGISEGPRTLSGSRLQVGVNSNGAIGFGSTGVKLDGTEYLFGNDQISTYFGAVFDNFIVRNTGDRAQTDIPMSVNNESDFANRRVVTTGVYNGFGVRRTLSFGLGDQLIAIDVTLSNRSTLVMNNVAWLEGLGARQGYNLPTDDPATRNLTINNVSNGTLRLATSSFDGKTIGMAVPASGGASSMLNVVTSFSAPGVARDPIAVLSNPQDPDPSMADTGAAGEQDMTVAVNVGTLAPGQSLTFRYFIFVGNTLNEVTTQFNTLESGTGVKHLVANPRATGIVGSDLPYAIYYPEGYANSRASTFLPIVNAGAEPVRVVVIARYEKSNVFSLPVSEILYDSATDETSGTIAPGARAGITLTTPDLYANGTSAGGGLPGRVQSLITGRNGVFKDTPYALEIRTSAPVGATMSHYDFGITTGQSALSELSATWTFAEAQKGSGINDFVVFMNPNTSNVKVTMTFYGNNGQVAQTFTQTVEAGRRGGWSINDLPIANGKYAVKVDAEQPIIAALTHFNSTAGNGYGATGLPSSGSLSGATAQGQVGITATSENIRVLNAGNASATVTFTFAFANSSSYRRTLNVPAGSNRGFSVSQLVGFPRGQAYGISYTSTAPVTVSLPTDTSVGTSGATFTSQASTQWLFGDGFKPASGNAVTEYLRVFNPSLQDQTIEIQMNYNNGTSEVFRRTVQGRSTANYNLFDFITGTASTTGTVPGVGSFYGVRVLSAVPIVAFTGHFDSFLGGGFGYLGTPIGTTGTPA